MDTCPVCTDELDDGYCHTCEHDLYDEPEWFLNKAASEIKRLRRALDDIKVRSYELGQREIHDMALAALETDDE